MIVSDPFAFAGQQGFAIKRRRLLVASANPPKKRPLSIFVVVTGAGNLRAVQFPRANLR
jgi:hypothetical protein